MHAGCTMDISPRGARLSGVHYVTEAGEVLCIERGKNKAYYRVMWIGTKQDGREHQVGLQCVEPDAAIWGVDVLPGEDERYEAMKKTSRQSDEERRRNARYQVPGTVHIFKDANSTDALYGEIGNLSATGCFVRMGTPLASGSKIRMSLKIPKHQTEFSVRGMVRMSDKAIGMWVEFTEIASYDAPKIEELLKKLEKAQAQSQAHA